MDIYSSIILALDIVLAIFFLYALYFISRLVKRKPVTTAAPKPVPPSPTVEAPSNTDAVQMSLKPKPQNSTAVSPERMERVQLSEPKPQTTPAKTDLAQQPREPEPKPAPVTTPAKTEQIRPPDETVKVEHMESQSEKTVQGPTQTIDRGARLIDIEGIGPTNVAKFNSIKISTTADLLEAGATPQGRNELVKKTGISHKLIMEWVDLADLFRIKGVGEEYSDLLEEAGVDTVVELSKRVPEHLHGKMLEVNAKKHLVRRPPSLRAVSNWVDQAKKLKRIVEH